MSRQIDTGEPAGIAEPAVDILAAIATKRDGGRLSLEQWRGVVHGLLAGEVGDEQVAALLMAGVIRGLDEREAVDLTEVLVASGEVVDLSELAGPTVDKHSTGGVGDTTTLIVGPLVAACGLQLAKLSGRGLGHTGGTLDKLESIPGVRVDLDPAEVVAQVRRHGLAVAAATQDLVPADKRLYALRDVTGTVASPALIASSIMSKKLAGGARHIVLDVKVGDGAFLPQREAAADLAALCVRIGQAHGRAVAALLTDMDQPLAPAVGNALEVAAAIEVLRGGGDARLAEVSLALAARLLELTGVPASESEATVRRVRASGAALEAFRELVVAQGGPPNLVDDPWEVLPRAPVQVPWTGRPGRIAGMRTRELGVLAGRLGAGRQRLGAPVDPRVGLFLHARPGAVVDGRSPVVTVHAATDDDAAMALARLDDLVDIAEDLPRSRGSSGESPGEGPVLARIDGPAPTSGTTGGPGEGPEGR